MKNSICLPIPTAEDSPHIQARCFVLFDIAPLEMKPYPFTRRAIREMTAALKVETSRGIETMEWCPTLFFPEAWPPEIIAEFLRSPSWAGMISEP